MPKIRGQKPPGNQRKSVSDAAGNNITDQGDVINAPVKDTEEILSGLVPTAADTTRNKKHTIQREHVELEWRDIFDAADDFIFISDADYKITRANRALANALKMEPPAIIGKRCYELLHKTHEPPLSCPHRQTLNSKKSASAEIFEPTIGLYLDKGISPIFAENGNLTHCVHAIRDVTKKRLAAETVRESNEQLASALRATQDGMWDWNIETNDIWYSPRWLQMFGYSTGEIKANAHDWERLLYPEDAKRVRKTVYAVLRGQAEFNIEFRLKHKDDHYLDIYIRGEPIRRIPGGPITRIVGTYFDLTERKRFERELQKLYQNEMELRQKLENEIRKRVNFTNILVHELKNPLTPVVTCSEILVRHLQEGVQLRLAKNIYNGATELDQRVDELLSPTLNGTITGNVLNWAQNLTDSKNGAINQTTTVDNKYLGLAIRTALIIFSLLSVIFMILLVATAAYYSKFRKQAVSSFDRSDTEDSKKLWFSDCRIRWRYAR